MLFKYLIAVLVYGISYHNHFLLFKYLSKILYA